MKNMLDQNGIEGGLGGNFDVLIEDNDRFVQDISARVEKFEKSEAEFINILSLFYLRIMMIENNNNDVDEKSAEALIEVKNKLQNLLNNYDSQDVSKKAERISALKHIIGQIDYILDYKDKDEKGATGSEEIKVFNAFVKKGAEIWEAKFAQNN